MDGVFDDNSTLVLLCFHGDGKKEAEGFLSEGICQFLDALVDCERVQVQHSFPKRVKGHSDFSRNSSIVGSAGFPTVAMHIAHSPKKE